MPKRDNASATEKVALRRRLLRAVEAPVAMETHGGAGHLFRSCYAHIATGVVFEKDERKASLLAGQRPSWAVYQGDCVAALAAGAGAHLAVNLLDVDPYGEPWPVLDAFFQSERPRADTLHVVVTDGLRQRLSMGGAWQVESLRGVVARFGNDLHDRYLDICEVLVAESGAQAGYRLRSFDGFHCGHAKQMTLYYATLTRGG